MLKSTITLKQVHLLAFVTTLFCVLLQHVIKFDLQCDFWVWLLHICNRFVRFPLRRFVNSYYIKFYGGFPILSILLHKWVLNWSLFRLYLHIKVVFTVFKYMSESVKDSWSKSNRCVTKKAEQKWGIVTFIFCFHHYKASKNSTCSWQLGKVLQLNTRWPQRKTDHQRMLQLSAAD